MDDEYAYDVTLSFAGEDRAQAEAVATELAARGIGVFYDAHEKAILWGKDLFQYLSDLYRRRARFCVVFVSRHYAEKLWTRHELKAAQARAFEESREYLLPVRLDDTEIPGLLPTTGFLRIPPETAATIANALESKLGKAALPHTPRAPAPGTPAARPAPAPAADRLTLFDALCAMTAAQLDAVVFRTGIARAELLPDTVPQSQRATDLVARLEQPGGPGLAALEAAIRKTAPHLLGA